MKSRPARAAPTPMPALAPVLRPEDEDEDEDGDGDGTAKVLFAGGRAEVSFGSRVLRRKWYQSSIFSSRDAGWQVKWERKGRAYLDGGEISLRLNEMQHARAKQIIRLNDPRGIDVDRPVEDRDSHVLALQRADPPPVRQVRRIHRHPEVDVVCL
jgi:hypothetical protein